MDFEMLFNQSVSGRKMINFDVKPSFLIPNLYTCINLIPTSFLKLLGGGTSQADYPFSFSFSSMDCSLFIYTLNGSCQLSSIGFNATIGQNTGLLWDCRQPFTLQTSILPWKFKLFFLSGTDLAAFHDLNPHLMTPFKIYDHSFLQLYFSKLSGIPSNYTISDALIVHKTLTDILCELYKPSTCTSESITTSKIPSYLIELKNQLDQNYQLEFSLTDLEDTLKINKYRLCREFSKTYGAPPLRYLNQRRIDVAKEMLLTTDYNIHEISSMIGYENINHFINLFKKSTGLTPTVFKQTVLEHQ